MVLKTILKKIEDSPDVPFNVYFTKFVLRVQDEILDSEVASVAAKSNTTVGDVQLLIDSISKRF